ncbi:MAG TPA: helix-turn-helix domain-containing protein [Gemmataceae bacterium]|jgi:excisionase family DNA binding protein|nr:helix-turn-helix domain-containing protein [Gemmataceae bacterium]
MVQGYYTLEEAARILGLATEKLSQMAQKREVRAFADRGTWRFRSQDIEELARRMGKGSNPDLQLGETQPPASGSPRPKSAAKADSPRPKAPVKADSPRPKAPAKADSPPPKSGAKPAGDAGTFDFAVSPSDSVELGQEISIDVPSSRRNLSPSPKPGSDSDVKLVPDDSDVDFKIRVDDSEVKVEGLGPGSKSPSSRRKVDSSPRPGKPSSGRKSGLGPAMDSGVRLVPLEDETGAPPPKSPSDSDIRVEVPTPAGSPASGEDSLTEEIDLDAELRKAEEASRSKKPRAKVKPRTGLKKPQDEPTAFEMEAPPSKTAPKKPAAQAPSSSEFELDVDADQPTHAGAPGAADDEEVALGELGSSDLSGSSGINLHSPDDSGINLEQAAAPGDDKIEFELSLDQAGSTPKPAPAAAEDEDSSSEFELSLDVESTPKPAPAAEEDDSSSEFELSLDVESTPKPAPAAPEDDSSSEFELTLDDSGGLAPMEEAAGEDKDIFETDFEVPALEDESASEAVALDDDTALESSDFDLSLTEEESGSQVVALEGEAEADEEAATVARPALAEGEEGDEVDELLGEDIGVGAEGEEEYEEEAVGAPAAVAAPAPWGVLPAAFMLPCVLVMFVVALMSFELIHDMWGYRQPYQPTSFVTRGVAGVFGVEMPGESKPKK